MGNKKESWLDFYAVSGSVSYGRITAERMRDILLGSEPDEGEKVRLRQGLMETPGAPAHDLAHELGVSFFELDDRVKELLGSRLPR